jgi:hypothetical protein
MLAHKLTSISLLHCKFTLPKYKFKSTRFLEVSTTGNWLYEFCPQLPLLQITVLWDVTPKEPAVSNLRVEE